MACDSTSPFRFYDTAFQKGMKLPGSRPDVVRTKALSGPSPVGGSFGGTESQRTMSLDDFELQAAHYNMACAHARLGNLDEVSFVDIFYSFDRNKVLCFNNLFI